MIIETIAQPVVVRPSPVTAVTRRRRPLLAAACWGYLLAVVAVWVVMREFGDRSWLATVLLIAPRWPYAVPLAVLAPWVLVARRLWLAGVVAGAAGFVLFAILGCRVALPGGPAHGDLRIFTCNVHRQHLEANELAKFIAEAQPDIIAIQGWSEADHESLFSSGRWNVHKEGELLVATPFPIGEVVPVDLSDAAGTPPGERGAAALYEIQTPRGSIYLMNMHLASPHGGLLTFSGDAGSKLAENIERRERESGLVLEHANQAKGPLLLAGDFNTVDDSSMFREHWGEFADAFTECGSGIGYTYMINHTQLRLDHVLADESWQFLRCWVGPDVGSPHRPLVVDMNYR